MDFRKISLAVLFTISAVIVVSLFWRRTVLTSLLLIGLVLIKHRLSPIELEFVWFVIAGIIGAIAEIIVVFSGVWYYAQPQTFDIPLWLPFLWGLTGLTWITFYEGITGKF